MSNPIDFKSLAQKIAQEKDYAPLLPVLEKELLHYEILAALDEARLLDNLVFQGGTSLRLCYGSERFSEDLDFAGGTNFNSANMSSIKEVLEAAITNRYDVEVHVREPGKRVIEQISTTESTVLVDCWQIQVITSIRRPDIPQQRIKLEVAAVPAHTKSIRTLLVNYAELPFGYSNILIPVEEPEEIAADKLLALAMSTYTRYRDIWDLRWLTTRPRFDKILVKELLEKKTFDYHVDHHFHNTASDLVTRLPELVTGDAFIELMRRFLPIKTLEQTLEREQFRVQMISVLEELYASVL